MVTTEKISATLPSVDLAFLKEYMGVTGTTRSGALHHAVQALREQSLEEAYRQADVEWYESGEAEVWETVSGDGLTL